MGVVRLVRPGEETEKSIDRIVQEVLVERQEYTDEIGNYHLNAENIDEDLGDFELGLDSIISTIFKSAPKLYAELEETEHHLIKFAIFHALLGYDTKIRKLGAHNYLNHPILVAQNVATAYEAVSAGGEDAVTDIVAALYHDRIEERVDKHLKHNIKRYKSQTRRGKLHSPEDRTIFAAFREIGETTLRRGKIPNYEGDLDTHIARYTKMFKARLDYDFSRTQRKLERGGISDEELLDNFFHDRDEESHATFLERLKQIGFTTRKSRERVRKYSQALHVRELFAKNGLNVDDRDTSLQRYRQLLERYIPDLNERVVREEKKFIKSEMTLFKRELTAGFRQIYGSDFKHNPTVSARFGAIIGKTRSITRVGSELYYEVCNTLFNDLVKSCDRAANSVDIDRAKRNPDIHYFTLKQNGKNMELNTIALHEFKHHPRLTWEGVLERQEYLQYYAIGMEHQEITDEWKINVIEEAEKLGLFEHYSGLSEEGIEERREFQRYLSGIVRHKNFSIEELIKLTDEEWNSEAITMLRKAFYAVTKANWKDYHLPDNNAEEERWRKVRQGDYSDPPERLKTHGRFYQVAKNYWLRNNTREKKQKGKSIKPTVEYIQDGFIERSRSESERIMEGTISNHCRGKHFSLDDVREIYQEMIQYEEDGGFLGTTEEGESKFDGLMKRYFDTRARGSKEPSEGLFKDKKEVFRTALAFVRVGELYQEDDTFYMRGVHKKGLRLKPAVGKTNGNGVKHD